MEEECTRSGHSADGCRELAGPQVGCRGMQKSSGSSHLVVLTAVQQNGQALEWAAGEYRSARDALLIVGKLLRL
eukprot:1981812-Amphidinium_carterae.1